MKEIKEVNLEEMAAEAEKNGFEEIGMVEITYDYVEETLFNIERQYSKLYSKLEKKTNELEEALASGKKIREGRRRKKLSEIKTYMYSLEIYYIHMVDVGNQMGYTEQLQNSERLNKPNKKIEEEIMKAQEKIRADNEVQEQLQSKEFQDYMTQRMND